MSLAMDILNIQSNERLSLCNTSWKKQDANELRLNNSNRLWKTIRSTVLKLALGNLKFRTVAISTWKLFHLWRWAFFLLPPGSPRRFSDQFYSEFYSCLFFIVVVGELMEERFQVSVIDRPFNQAEVLRNDRQRLLLFSRAFSIAEAQLLLLETLVMTFLRSHRVVKRRWLSKCSIGKLVTLQAQSFSTKPFCQKNQYSEITLADFLHDRTRQHQILFTWRLPLLQYCVRTQICPGFTQAPTNVLTF